MITTIQVPIKIQQQIIDRYCQIEISCQAYTKRIHKLPHGSTDNDVLEFLENSEHGDVIFFMYKGFNYESKIWQIISEEMGH